LTGEVIGIVFGDVGNKTLTGGSGADAFVFASSVGAGNADRIMDFKSGVDQISLENGIFTGMGVSVTTSELRFGSNAQDTDDRLIYNATTGRLFFDADANGAGVKRLIATLDVGDVLVVGDFVLF